jgi:hypothetical protein
MLKRETSVSNKHDYTSRHAFNKINKQQCSGVTHFVCCSRNRRSLSFLTSGANYAVVFPSNPRHVVNRKTEQDTEGCQRYPLSRTVLQSLYLTFEIAHYHAEK